jgi:hypothetical protein
VISIGEGFLPVALIGLSLLQPAGFAERVFSGALGGFDAGAFLLFRESHAHGSFAAAIETEAASGARGADFDPVR